MIPTAEEFAEFKLPTGISWYNEFGEMMIEFAKLHVEAALKAASERATIDDIGSPNCDGEWMSCDIVNIDSILNSYPLDNIK